MRAKIKIGYKDYAMVQEELENIFQVSEAKTTVDVPTCGRGLIDKTKKEFKSIQNRQAVFQWLAPSLSDYYTPEKVVHLKIRWKDSQMLERATDFFDYVAPVYAASYKYENIVYSASPTGMDVIYQSDRPLWLPQLWVSWNIFLNRTEKTALR